MNAKTGKEKRKLRTRDDVISSPIVVNGVVYFGSWDGYLYAVQEGN